LHARRACLEIGPASATTAGQAHGG
jgi:hypothetical protein